MFWYIDPSHTAVNFSVRHMMLSTVRGSLGKVSGRIELDPAQPEKGDFEVTAAVKGINTGDERRDGHLRSADFFDAEKYPEVTFKSNAIFPKGDGRYTASGDLTIRAITRAGRNPASNATPSASASAPSARSGPTTKIAAGFVRGFSCRMMRSMS